MRTLDDALVDTAPFPAGRGEMGLLIGSKDWSQTPLGPVDQWPHSLRTAVGICLGSRFPMFLWWGPSLINLYNDAYIPILGRRHPDALGRPAHELWQEVWPVVGPQAEAVMSRGEASWHERVPLILERNGYPEEAYFTWSHSPVPREDGAIGGVLCVVTEETAAVHAERERLRLAAQHQLALDAAQMGWWHYDPRTEIATFDQRSRKMFGISDGHQPVAKILHRLHPDDVPDLLAKMKAALDPADPRPYSIEYRIALDDGSIRWIEAHGVATFDGEGANRHAINLVGTVGDITDRKLASERSRTILESISDAFFALDRDWRFTYVNSQAARVLQRAPDELLSRVIWDEYPTLRETDFEKVYRDAAEQRVVSSVTSYFADHDRWYEVHAYPAQDGISVYFRDVSDRKRAEQANTDLLAKLEQQARLFDAALSAVQDYFYLFDLDGRFLLANKALLQLWGLTAEQAIGRTMRELNYPPDVEATLLANIRRVIETRQPVQDETSYISPVGSSGDYEYILAPVFAPDGSVEAVAGTSRDVSLRNRVRRELQSAKAAVEENLARWQAVVGSMAEGVVVADAAGNLPEWNAAALEMHGYASLEEVRRRLNDFPEVLELSTAEGQVIPLANWPMSRVLRSESFSSYEVNVCRLDVEHRRVISYSGSPIRDRSGKLVMAVLTLHDVTVERLAQAAVRESEQRLRALFEQSSAGIAQSDLTGRILLANERFCQITGRSMQEVLGVRVQDLTHPDDVAETARLIATGAATGAEYSVEKRYLRKDGTVVWGAVNASILKDAAGHPQLIIGVIVDITDRKRAEAALRESQQRLQLAVSIAEMGTFEINLLTDAVTVNESGREIYGWPPDQVLTFHDVQTHFHPDDRDEVMRQVGDALRPQGPGEFAVEQRIIRTDGAIRWIRVRGRALFEIAGGEQRAVRCVGTYLDITEQREAEHRREQLLLAERAARTEAERASQLKDEFLATVSHELRTPLNAILGYAQLLQNSRQDADTADGLEIIERNARMQRQIIEDILDMSRIVSGKLRLNVQRVNLAQVIDASIETVRPAVNAKGIKLVRTIDPRVTPVSGDPSRLQQVVWNLLTNAVKFTPRHGRVAVELRQVDSHAEIVVSDTGQGIPPEFLPHVFDKFRQADASTTRKHAGLGLGLSIVKSLVELHGGTAAAYSSGKDAGATFTVRVPLLEAVESADGLDQQPHRQQQLDDCPSLKGLRVLTVDDEPDARDLLRRILEDCGATVLTAASANEALRVLDRERVDVLLSDIGMAEMDGYELLRRIRRRSAAAGGNIPAAALTAFARSEDRTRALMAGFQTHIAKPLEPVELIFAVANLAQRATAT